MQFCGLFYFDVMFLTIDLTRLNGQATIANCNLTKIFDFTHRQCKVESAMVSSTTVSVTCAACFLVMTTLTSVYVFQEALALFSAEAALFHAARH